MKNNDFQGYRFRRSSDAIYLGPGALLVEYYFNNLFQPYFDSSPIKSPPNSHIFSQSSRPIKFKYYPHFRRFLASHIQISHDQNISFKIIMMSLDEIHTEIRVTRSNDLGYYLNY